MPDHLLPLLENPVIIDIFCVCDSILYKVSSLGYLKHEPYIYLKSILSKFLHYFSINLLFLGGDTLLIFFSDEKSSSLIVYVF